MGRRRMGGDGGGGITEALIYTRVSSDEQEKEGLSLPAQLAACRRYVGERADRGWIIGEEYTDVLTGKRDDRARYQAMLADIRRLRAEGRRVVVVCAWLHRLGRRLQERVNSREELKALGVATHSAKEGGEVSDLVANILASVAEEEVRQLGERVAEVNGNTKRNGWRVVGRCPWGYRWRERTAAEKADGAPEKVLALDEAAAPHVAKAFKRVAGGESVRSVARDVAALPSAARGGRSLSFEAVDRALRAPVYAGWSEPDANGVRHRGRWPAIVAEATFQRVQDRLARHRRGAPPSGRYLLTGWLFCPECGSRMGGRVRRPESGRAGRYACISKMLGAAAPKPGCEFTVTMPVVDGLLRAEVGALVEAVTTADPRRQALLERRWKAMLVPDVSRDIRVQIRREEGKVARGKQRLANASLRLIDGDLDKAGYDGAKALIERDMVAAQAELDRLRAEAGDVQASLPPWAVVVAVAGGVRAAMEAADTPLLREGLTRLIARVVPHREGRGRYRMEIDWTPLGAGLRRLTACNP